MADLPPDASPALDPSPLDELADIVADLRAWVDWQGLLGATLLPREAAPTVRGGGPSAGPRREPAPRSADARSADPRSADPRSAASPPGRPAGPAPGRGPAPPAARPPRAASPAAPPRPAPPASGGPPPAALEGRWAALARPGGMFTGAPDAPEELRALLREAVQRPDAGDRLAAIREAMGDCRRCGLCEARQHIVFGVGSPQARLVVLGEGPGEQEDRQGEPFVGPAGQMLDRMIENVLGLARDQVYILNMVKCRPPQNRNPLPAELDACRPFLDAQLSAIGAPLVLVLGSVASRALLGQGITSARGRWHSLRWSGGEARAMATFHPAYLLRKPEDKRLTFEDLKLLRAALAEPG